MKRILIDTDPGIDDSMAIFFALRSPEVNVEGLTTVFGNSSTATTTDNALRLVELAGREDIPVARGAEKPLLRPFGGDGWRVHGRNGLGEISFPPAKSKPEQRRAAQFIVDLVMNNPGEISLVSLGPLTNLALAVSLEPRIAEVVNGVVIMGGAANARGNASPVAEANILNDPEAAKIVFETPWPLTMVGLDVTRKTIMTPAYVEKLCSAGNRFTDFIKQIIPFYLSFYKEVERLDGFPVHDSSALAYVIAPTLFTTRAMSIQVETGSPLSLGLTAADWRPGGEGKSHIQVCVDVNSQSLLDLYEKRLGEPDNNLIG